MNAAVCESFSARMLIKYLPKTYDAKYGAVISAPQAIEAVNWADDSNKMIQKYEKMCGSEFYSIYSRRHASIDGEKWCNKHLKYIAC